MRNILNFVIRNYLVFLFAFLEFFCIYLVVQNSYYQRATTVNSANFLVGNVYATYNRVSQYFYLKEENENLARENAILHSMLKESYEDFIKIQKDIDDTVYKQKYRYFSAKVINNSVNKRNNYLTLNRGSDSGVHPEMAVISSNGVVGIVKNVSKNFCTVMSMLHKDFRLSAEIKKNKYFGSLTWNGLHYANADLADIPKHVVLHKGDTIVTSHHTKIFPEGIMLGTIDNFSIGPADNFYTISVKLSTNFKTLTNVYLIDNLLKEEQIKLEEETEAQTNDD